MKVVKTTNEFIILLNCLIYKIFEKDFFLFLENKEFICFKDRKKIKYRMSALVKCFESIVKIENLQTILAALATEKENSLQQRDENSHFQSYAEIKAMLYYRYYLQYKICCFLISKLEKNVGKKINFIELEGVLFFMCIAEKSEYKKCYKKIFPKSIFKKKALTVRLRKNQKIEENKYYVVENTNLKLNLFFYHSIIQNFIEKIKLKNEFSFEDYTSFKLRIFDNIMELHFIIVTQPSKDLLNIVFNCKKYLMLDLLEHPNETDQYAFDKFEKQHYDSLIEVLETKQKNNEVMRLDLNAFLEKFARFDK